MIDETRYERALQKSGGYFCEEIEKGVFEAQAIGLDKSARGATIEEARDNLFDAIFEAGPEKKAEPLPEFTQEDVDFLEQFAEGVPGEGSFDFLMGQDDVREFADLASRIEAHIPKEKEGGS